MIQANLMAKMPASDSLFQHMEAAQYRLSTNQDSSLQNWKKCYSIRHIKLTERWTPLEWHSFWSLSCCQIRWHSTWLTAGGTRAMASKSSIFLQEKLLTPIARALPESYSFSIASHVAGISGGRMFSWLGVVPFFIRIGAWICKIRSFQQPNEVISGVQLKQLCCAQLLMYSV